MADLTRRGMFLSAAAIAVCPPLSPVPGPTTMADTGWQLGQALDSNGNVFEAWTRWLFTGSQDIHACVDKVLVDLMGQKVLDAEWQAQLGAA